MDNNTVRFSKAYKKSRRTKAKPGEGAELVSFPDPDQLTPEEINQAEADEHERLEAAMSSIALITWCLEMDGHNAPDLLRFIANDLEASDGDRAV